METLPSSVSSLKVPSRIQRTSAELCRFRPPTSSSNLHSQNHHLISPSINKPNNSLSNKPTSFPHKTLPFLSTSSQPSLPLKQQSPPPLLHRNAASGYAAALIDAARCHNSLGKVERDVKRLSKLLRNEELRAFMSDSSVKEKEKGKVVKEIAEKGKFDKRVVVLLKMLVEKTKWQGLLGMVSEVLVEFERICDQMSGTTQVVVVSSKKKKIEEGQLFGIAKKVQKLSGALRVKVRHSFDESLLSF